MSKYLCTDEPFLKLLADALRDLVSVVKLKKREKYPSRSVTFTKVY